MTDRKKRQFDPGETFSIKINAVIKFVLKRFGPPSTRPQPGPSIVLNGTEFIGDSLLISLFSALPSPLLASCVLGPGPVQPHRDSAVEEFARHRASHGGPEHGAERSRWRRREPFGHAEQRQVREAAGRRDGEPGNSVIYFEIAVNGFVRRTLCQRSSYAVVCTRPFIAPRPQVQIECF